MRRRVDEDGPMATMPPKLQRYDPADWPQGAVGRTDEHGWHTVPGCAPCAWWEAYTAWRRTIDDSQLPLLPPEWAPDDAFHPELV